ncbi:unnamed protein product [Gordionus sp. m RMFG-2023]
MKYKRFLHWGPLIATFIISTLSPGLVPLEWNKKNKNNIEYLQWCNFCKGYKPPRAHHCRRCQRCVMKMDHHCPWINTCVGHFNQKYFIYFLISAVLGCLHSSVLLIYTLYLIIKNPYAFYLFRHTEFYVYLLHLFTIGLSIGVVLFVSILCYFQLKAVLYNTTEIEDWIIKKILRFGNERNSFKNPFDLGVKKNLKQFFGLDHTNIILDGMNWPVRDGCTLYSLSIEQKKLKQFKEECSILYVCKHDYNANLFSLRFGILTFLNVPCTSEPRLYLRKNDTVQTTRWKKYWLYGKKLNSMGQKTADKTESLVVQQSDNKAKGWFPRNLVKLKEL